MKLTKQQERKLAETLKHITGECLCSANSTTCAYWKNVDKGGDWQIQLILKEIKALK